mgnify:CR=1 FL=1
MSDQENHDVFSKEEVATETETKEEVSTDAEQEAKADGEESAGAEKSEQQGEEGTEPPAVIEDNKVSEKDKMIPEHRFKAALKDVADKYERRIAELTPKVAPPDQTTDPKGYERHVRIEVSKTMMTEMHADYDDMIEHFQEMAKVNPMLNQVVGEHAMPAKMAYDLAKRDMENAELAKLKDDPELKEFREWKKTKAAAPDTATQLEVKPKPASAASKVPNLNRNNPSASRANVKSSSEDDDLFAGHHSQRA